MIELRVDSLALAVWLGADKPQTTFHHRELRDAGRHIIMRERGTGYAAFWEIAPELSTTVRSS